MQESIKVIYFKVGKQPKEITIPNRLSALQELVGGYIEVLTVASTTTEDILLICNEYGRIQGLPINRCVYGEFYAPDRICGDFFLCKADGEDMGSLTMEEAKAYLDFTDPGKISLIRD